MSYVSFCNYLVKINVDASSLQLFFINFDAMLDISLMLIIGVFLLLNEFHKNLYNFLVYQYTNLMCLKDWGTHKEMSRSGEVRFACLYFDVLFYT